MGLRGLLLALILCSVPLSSAQNSSSYTIMDGREDVDVDARFLGIHHPLGTLFVPYVVWDSIFVARNNSDVTALQFERHADHSVTITIQLADGAWPIPVDAMGPSQPAFTSSGDSYVLYDLQFGVAGGKARVNVLRRADGTETATLSTFMTSGMRGSTVAMDGDPDTIVVHLNDPDLRSSWGNIWMSTRIYISTPSTNLPTFGDRIPDSGTRYWPG